MSFSSFNLNPNIQKAITAVGYKEPTPVQAAAIPVILEGKDVIACAQTGTGKTAAFVVPAFDQLCELINDKKKIETSILILAPTRELASQITQAATDLANQISQASKLEGNFLKFRIVNLVGGMPYHNQIRALNQGVDILVATPGRLLDHIQQKHVNLSHIKMLILDEADRMLDMGFIDDVKAITSLTPSNRQTLLFSATVDNKLSSFVKSILNNPLRIDLSLKKLTAPKIDQAFYAVSSPYDKLSLLTDCLNKNNIYKAIIFSATKINADKLAIQLRDKGYQAAALHGDLRQKIRNRTLDQFRFGKVQILVATDVAARGIDINDISLVINYDMPRFCEDYVHRIGRTGRAGKEGSAISFVLPADKKHLQRIERYIGKRFSIINSHHNKSHDQSNDGYEENFHDFKKFPKANRNKSESSKYRSSEYKTSQQRPRTRRFSEGASEQKNSRQRFSERASEQRPSRRRFSEGALEQRPSRQRFSGEASEQRPSRRRFSEDTSEQRPSRRRFSEDTSEQRPSRRRFSGEASEQRPFRQRFSGGTSEQKPRRRFSEQTNKNATSFSEKFKTEKNSFKEYSLTNKKTSPKTKSSFAKKNPLNKKIWDNNFKKSKADNF